MTVEQTAKGRRAFIQRLGVALAAAVAFCEDKLFGQRAAVAPNVTLVSLRRGTGDVRIYSEGTVETTHFLATNERGDDRPIPELENHVTEIVWRLSATGGEAKLTKRGGEIQIVLAPVPLLSRFDNFIPGTPAEVKRHAEALLEVAAQLQAIEDENVRSGKWQREARKKRKAAK